MSHLSVFTAVEIVIYCPVNLSQKPLESTNKKMDKLWQGALTFEDPVRNSFSFRLGRGVGNFLLSLVIESQKKKDQTKTIESTPIIIVITTAIVFVTSINSTSHLNCFGVML